LLKIKMANKFGSEILAIKTMTRAIFFGLLIVVAGRTASADPNSVDTVLKKLSCNTSQLRFLQADIEYVFSQPLFESKTVRKGRIYYKKDSGSSALRMNFATLKQDDEKAQKYLDEYLFDGVWLKHIDYQVKQLKCYQQAEPNKPIDAFELAKKTFPLVGFGKAEQLYKNFDIKQLPPKANDPSLSILLTVKPGCDYAANYKTIEFRIDKDLFLPVRIIAVTTEDDISEIILSAVKVNEKIGPDVFELNIPEDFSTETFPIDKG